MRYWLTTHWPLREGSTPSDLSGIWLPEGRHAHGSRIAPGDLVAVYEAANGRTRIRQTPAGDTIRVRCGRGREGVIFLGRVEAPMSADSSAEVEQYADGTKIWWRWHAPVRVLSRSGFVSRPQLLQIRGHKPGYYFRGLGERKSGLAEISEAEFEAIREVFVAASAPQLPSVLTLPGNTHAPGAGESVAHRELKDYVATCPAVALNEAGLSTLQKEYPFGTGDRADIVLTDSFGRIVGVEIEPSVDDKDDAGPLQAIKYRRMLEWATGRSLGDSRSLLIAYEISDAMKKRCARYGIECFEIPLATVAAWVAARA